MDNNTIQKELQTAIKKATDDLNRLLEMADEHERAPTVGYTIGGLPQAAVQLRNPYWWTNGNSTKYELD